MQSTSSQSDKNSVFREEAIPFIIYEQEKRRFELTQEATDFLKQVNGPIGLVAVAGMYRTGKSYLLNRMLLNRSNGFGVGPSINPCTKGLWVWGKPISGFTPEGEPINVLIVDTEGLGALDEDSNHDVRIFSLAVLLSSYFLYNSVGSIDESALSNLSLVINLTKNIHIKSKGSNEDIDTEEYGTYFPSFMWVVRDFTLQLVDQEGEQISSKEYLEKALENQKGFSDNVEQKNRIRRLMKSFFKERDCCTMIRPLTNEENLQNLANMELDELRADFVEQVMQLRRKVINRVKPKMLNGKKLNGAMLANLAASYVTSINNGAVPNIETAWQYICKSECGKAIDESLKKFEDVLRDSVLHKIPMDEDELKSQYEEAKKEAITLFQKKAVGGIAEEYMKELKYKMKQTYISVKEENQRESINACSQFLMESYSFIERKLKNKEFPGGFAEYYQDIQNFMQYFIDNGPTGPERRLILFDFVQRQVSEAAEFLTKTITNELDLQRQIASEQHKNLEAQLKELKTDHYKEKEFFESKVRSIEIEKAELSAIEQSLRENLERLSHDKVAAERELYEKFNREKKEFLREIEEYKNKLSQTENHASEMQRKVFATESENEKERALLEQKIEFLERTIQDYQKKETEYSTEMKAQKKDHQTLLRDMQTKYEQQIRILNTKLEETTEKLLETQGSLEEIDQKYNFEKQKWEESQLSLKNTMTMSQGQYNEMIRSMEELKVKSRTEIDRLQLELTDLKEQSRTKEEELENAVKDRDEEIKAMKNRFEKEMAIYKQKIEFKEVQTTQLKSQLDETRKTHESLVKAMENKAKESHDGKEYAQKQVQELKEQHTQELRDLEREYQEARQRLEAQVDQLNEKNNDLELKYKLLKNEFDKETENLKGQLESLDTQRQRAVDMTKNIDSQKLRLLEETEERYKIQINQLEKELEEKESKALSELRDVQVKSEESLAQLKNFYEIEKERLEHRLAEEKERAQKKIAAQQEEFDQRLRDQQQQYEEDIEMLQEELRENDRRYQTYQNQMEHENALMTQKIETLESYLKEKEERLSKEQSLTASQMEAQLERFNTERKELFTKIENLNSTLTSKDRELTIVKNKYDSQIDEIEKKRRQLDEMKAEMVNEKTKLNEKIESLRVKNQQLTDDFMQKKLEDGREIALYKQKLEFQQKKIEDLQKTSDEMVQKYEERIAQQKQDFQQELQETYNRANQSKEHIEMKYEQKRKQFKEQEANYLRQITEVQKEKAVLDEKFQNSETKKEEQRIKLESEVQLLKEQLMNAGDQVNKDREIFIQENERLKSTLQEMEKEFSEVQSSYERDKALWEGKFQFLEQQKEQAKVDLQDATRKFEMTLEQLHKRGSADRDKIEHSQNALLGTLEQKYKTQLKEQIENNQRTYNELSEKVKYLEKENRQLQNRLQLEQRDKMSDHGTMEKKVQELIENEARLAREIDELKQERDRKIIENQKVLEKERETFKGRLQEVEQKCKELENRRSTMIFEFEKERAKWGLERDHLVSQKQEVQEQVDRLQRRQETLLRENEKLKNERGSRKQFMYGAGGVGASNNGLPGANGNKFTPAMFGQTLLKNIAQKENTTTTSQMFQPGSFAKFIGDGAGSQSDKADPTQLPFQSKDSTNIVPTQFGSTVAFGAGSLHQKNGSSGGSFKSGGNFGVSKDGSSDTNSNC